MADILVGCRTGNMDKIKRFVDKHGLPESTLDELRSLLPDHNPTAYDPEDSLLPDADGVVDGPAEPGDGEHLTLEHCLGRGAMGEVWLAQDSRLSRQVAVKLLGQALLYDPAAVARFLDEARATAQLVHPGIVPVHDVGWWQDGRPFYTMDVIRGDTLTTHIEMLHVDYSPEGLHRLVNRFRQVCDAVGYAHSRGVVHRDLKPDNVMVGAFGQVLVADWGLVRADQEAAEPVFTERSADQTAGMAGTPRFMSPEQVSGELVGTASDVYSLGSILVSILSGGHAFPQKGIHGVLVAVAMGRAQIPEVGPEDLRAIAHKALQRQPEDRYPTAAELGDAVQEWLDGATRRARALEDVAAGEAMLGRIASLEAKAQALRDQVAHSTSDLATWMPIERKVGQWRLEDQAKALEQQAATLRADRLAAFESALSHDPDLPEAKDRLSAHHRAQVIQAEAFADTETAARHLRQLRRYDQGQHADFLHGQARLSLDTLPAGATVTCRPYVASDRRMVPGDAVDLGTTPLVEVPIDMGEYELTLEAPGRPPVVYPVFVGRQERWDGSGGEDQPGLVHLPETGQLGPDDCFIPPGPCWQGSEDTLTTIGWHRTWTPGFVLKKFAVSNTDYLRFLDDVWRTEGEEAAMRWAPRERVSNPKEQGPLCYGFSSERGFFLEKGEREHTWLPDYPVLQVDWDSCAAYAAWMARTTGQPWRLPTEREWEKAFRGPKGRDYPWDGPPDPAFLCIRGSHEGAMLPAVVDSYPTDCSVYGVRGMSGNQREWCQDLAGDQRVLKGGCWFFPARGAHGAARYLLHPHIRGDTIGFRIARSL